VSEARPLGRLEDFPDRSATPARYRKEEREVALLVVRCGDELRAYLDSCPHQFLPLTQRGRRVLSADGERLRCTNHGAEFAVADGRALSGPTGGCGLTPVALETGGDGTVLVNEGPGASSG
jgi:nitrite reductase/ring-hydroxylating ferredoxin subunit